MQTDSQLHSYVMVCMVVQRNMRLLCCVIWTAENRRCAESCWAFPESHHKIHSIQFQLIQGTRLNNNTCIPAMEICKQTHAHHVLTAFIYGRPTLT